MYKKRKKCFLCDTLIYYNRAACKEHAELYNQYKDEQWCKELVSAENKQGFIESKESASLHALNSNVLLNLYKNQQNPTRLDHKLIINLYEAGVKPKEIAKQLNVKIQTIYMIIYRKKKR